MGIKCALSRGCTSGFQTGSNGIIVVSTSVARSLLLASSKTASEFGLPEETVPLAFAVLLLLLLLVVAMVVVALVAAEAAARAGVLWKDLRRIGCGHAQR